MHHHLFLDIAHAISAQISFEVSIFLKFELAVAFVVFKFAFEFHDTCFASDVKFRFSGRHSREFRFFKTASGCPIPFLYIVVESNFHIITIHFSTPKARITEGGITPLNKRVFRKGNVALVVIIIGSPFIILSDS